MPDYFLRTLRTLLLLLAIFIFVFKAATEKTNLTTIDGDAKGYYAYLPALLINQSPDWKKLDATNQGYTNDFVVQHNNKEVNKYSPGTALFLFPFFLLSLLYCLITGQAADSFSFPFQYGVLLASLFYMVVGILFVAKFLKTYSFKKMNIFLTVFLFLFGTNLFYYSACEPGMSHVYAFCCISGFIFYTRVYFTNKQRKHFFLSVALLALAVLIRPTHILLIALIPFLSGNLKELRNSLPFAKTVQGFLIFFAVIFLQFILWYLQTGEIFVQPYKDEGFYFSDPQFLNSLFSFRKGLFIYTPLLFISLAGLLYLYKENKQQSMLLFLFLFLTIYVLSSWWNWYYGDSFGQRAFIDYYILFAYLFALTLEKCNRLLYYVILIFSFLFTGLNLIQTYQYSKHIIHPDAMTFEKYKAVFLKTGNNYENSLNGAPELFYIPRGEKIIKEYHPWPTDSDKIEIIAITQQKEYATILNTEIKEAFLSGRRTYMHTKLNFDKPFAEPDNETAFVISISDSAGNAYFWKSEKLFSIEKKEKEQEQEFGFRLPKIRYDSDILSVYIWNRGKKEFSVYDMKTELWEANE